MRSEAADLGPPCHRSDAARRSLPGNYPTLGPGCLKTDKVPREMAPKSPWQRRPASTWSTREHRSQKQAPEDSAGKAAVAAAAGPAECPASEVLPSAAQLSAHSTEASRITRHDGDLECLQLHLVLSKAQTTVKTTT